MENDEFESVEPRRPDEAIDQSSEDTDQDALEDFRFDDWALI
jgi:hypothetical protein